MNIKHIWVMTSIFQGHVTSSVTWSFDSHRYPFHIDAPLSPSL